MVIPKIALPLCLLISSFSQALPTSVPLHIELADRAEIVHHTGETIWTWDQGATPTFPIHRSCNASQSAQLKRAFGEAEALAQHAKEHIMRFGTDSEFYVKYFGNASTAEPAGWFEKVISGDKTGVLFRCDDIDNKCYQDGKLHVYYILS
jgi:hypothetical protein